MNLQPWHYIVLLGAIVLVWAFSAPRFNRNRAARQSDNGLENMENALEQFMENMEESNRSLAELVKASREQGLNEMKLKEQRIEELERQYLQLQESIQSGMLAADVKPESEERSATPVRAEVRETALEPDLSNVPNKQASIRSRYRELFELYEQGKSVDQISRMLGIHKGEILLIQQLARQEESADGV